jgi:autotransporter-associated beta strand protein
MRSTSQRLLTHHISARFFRVINSPVLASCLCKVIVGLIVLVQQKQQIIPARLSQTITVWQYKLLHRPTLLALIFLALLTAATFSTYAANALWSSLAGSAWLTATNWTGGSIPSATDVAQFGTNPTSGSTGIGINMNGSTNNGTNNQAIGAIEITNDRAADLLIGNSSQNASGTLTLNGATINSVNNVILQNSSGKNFTIRDTQGSGNKTMTVALANATDNIIYIAGTGGITISSSISGSGKNLTRDGSGTGILTLSGVNTYTGTTTVNTGTLLVNGSTDAASAVTVNSGGTLGGTGTVGGSVTVNSGGTVAPGASPGILNTGSVTFTSGATLSVEIGGTTPGNSATDHDQLNVTGSVSLNSATLSLAAFNGFTPTAGQTFTILNNDSNDALTTTFAGYAEGATISSFLGSSLSATISYVGGTGNDVVLTVINAPTAVTLASMTATAYDTGTLIEWQTGYEVGNLGFVVYREARGQRTALTPSLIAGSALRAGPGTALTAGLSYAWWDGGKPGATYWLEEWDVDGTRTLHGPISPRWVGGSAPAFSPAALLSQAGATSGSTQPVEPTAAAVTAARAQQLRSYAGQAAVKIGVRQSGWQRVTQAQLLAAGLNAATDPRTLQLFVDGTELPLFINGEQDGRFDAGDTLEFYGLGLDTPATDARVYWLVNLGSKAARRLGKAPFLGGAATPASFPTTVERKDRTLYFAGLLNGAAENFFGPVVTNTVLTLSLHSHFAERNASSPALLEVSLQGATAGTHAVSVGFNGTPLGTVLFADRQARRQSFPVAPELLREENALTFHAGLSGDVSVLAALRLSYPHTYQAENNLLRVPATAGQQVNVGGFTSAGVRVFDVTDEQQVLELETRLTQGTASVTAPGWGLRQLLFVGAGRELAPAQVKANVPSNWLAPGNAADLIILTHGSLREGFEPLAAYRRAQGWRVALVEVEDAYDELRQGQKDPAAVRELLRYAASSWTVKPRYVLLAGKATYDPRDYRGVGDFDLVPTQLIDTAQLETASDDALVDFNGDSLPELAVGRLPARSLAEAQQLVERILSYEKGAPSSDVLLVADRNEGYHFEQAAEALVGLLPKGTVVERLYRQQLGDAATRSRLLEALARGPKLVNYVGHGSIGLWRGNLLTSGDAAVVRSSQLSFFIAMTCLNGYVIEPNNEALSEAWLKAPGGGAIAVWASAALTGAHGQAHLNAAVYRQLFASGQTLGEATRAAKQSTTDLDVRRSWLLLGDPLLRLK